MNQQDKEALNHMEALAKAATPGEWQYGSTPVANPDEAVTICKDNIEATKAPIDQFYEVFLDNGLRVALVGNGPTSAANAEYLAALRPANILRLIEMVRALDTSSAPKTVEPPGWRDAMQRFCDRVERGEVRSKTTYAHFKALLAPHRCDEAPTGWYCTRVEGHDGPCAAWPTP